MKTAPLIPTKIVPSVSRADLPSRKVHEELQGIVRAGGKILASGTAKNSLEVFQNSRLKAKHKIELFDTQFYFTNVFQIPELRFFVCYVVQRTKNQKWQIWPRIVYKDLSLVWRSASHFSNVDDQIWIGKGDVFEVVQNGQEMIVSNEATTDLPLEMQTAVEGLLGFLKRPMNGKGILDLVLRKSPGDRIEPYRDFVAPREYAASNPKNLIHRGRNVLRFARRHVPESLKIVKGFEPDFQSGIIERGASKSRLYGGRLQRFRVLSTNKKVHYYFFAGAKHVWTAPPQALTTELSSYGVRTIDVVADDDLFIPGYEYHHYEETARGLELYSQIPAGFVGEECPLDDAKADASPWLDRIPLIQRFRKEVLGQR